MLEHLRILSNKEMAAADQWTIDQGTPGIVLMEKAGAGAASKIIELYEPRESEAPKVLILCGPGNNGGDGYVIARHLKDKGWDVSIYAFVRPANLAGDGAAMAKKWSGQWIGDSAEIDYANYDIVVDALFGTGLTRPLAPDLEKALEHVNRANVWRVAVDIPSGVCGDTGQILGIAFDAHNTITFHRKKRGHCLYPGRAQCGIIDIIAIGIRDEATIECDSHVYENNPALWLSLLPKVDFTSHKYNRGHVLVYGGNAATSGAARLAARAALRVGAGAVTVAMQRPDLDVYASQQTAVMNLPYKALEDIEPFYGRRRVSAAVIGPGHGLTSHTQEGIAQALKTKVPVVLDADAISVSADNPLALFDQLHSNVVLTPHEAEFGRLFPSINVSGNRLAAVQSAAHLAGCTVLLKGAATIVANANGLTLIHSDSSPYLATAGSGDILAGLIGGLMSGGMDPFLAASAAVWIHALAAEIAGPYAIAEDLGEAILYAMQSLKSS